MSSCHSLLPLRFSATTSYIGICPASPQRPGRDADRRASFIGSPPIQFPLCQRPRLRRDPK